MQTKKIVVTNKKASYEEILDLTEKVSADYSLKNKDKLHLRLLAEEMVSMIEATTGNFDALFWIEEDSGDFKLCLNAKTQVSSTARKDLLSVSSTGENTAARGIMGKIREIIEVGISHYDEIDRMNLQYGSNFYTCGAVGVDAADAMAGSLFAWSLNQYRDSMEPVHESDAWDEIEKSIVANIADDVRVGITSDSVELVISKRF